MKKQNFIFILMLIIVLAMLAFGAYSLSAPVENVPHGPNPGSTRLSEAYFPTYL